VKRPEKKTKEELVRELEQLRQRIDELELREARCQQAQEKVWQQKEFMTDVFNSMPYAMYVIDANDLTVKLASTTAIHEDGLPKNAKCYSHIHKKSKPCRSPDFVCLLEQVKEVKEPVTVECMANDETGAPTHIKFQGFPIFDNEGNVVYMLEARLSIEKRKRAEEALQESDLKYRKLFEEANDAIFLFEADTGYILDANKEAERLLGRNMEEIVGMHHTQLYAPEMAVYYENKFAEYLRAGHVMNFEAEVFKKNETIVPVNISASVITLHNKRLIQGIFRDVTERIQVEKALKESEKFTSNLLLNSPNPIFVCNRDRSIKYVNPALEKLVGFSSKELIGMKDPYPWCEKNASAEDGLYCNTAMQQGIKGYELLLKKKNGEKFWVEVTSTPIIIDNEIIYYLSNWVDINERKQAESQLLEYQKELRSMASQLSLAEERERRRIATEVHDHVSQNMAVCSMKLGALLESAPSARFAKDVGEIDAIIKQMINQTRALTFELSSPLLYELGLEAAVEQLTEQMQEQYEMRFNFAHDNQPNPLDDKVSVLVFQAVRELLVNSVKHSKARLIEVHMKRNDDYLYTSVEDDGIGFDTTQIYSHKKKTKGFGLFSIPTGNDFFKPKIPTPYSVHRYDP